MEPSTLLRFVIPGPSALPLHIFLEHLRALLRESIDLALAGASRMSLSIDEVASIRFPGRQPTSGSVLPEAPDEGDES